MKLQKLQETDALMNEGVWMRLDGHGTLVKLRYTFSAEYTQARERAEQRLRRRKAYKPDRELTGEETAEILREAVAKGLIVDWKGFFDGDNEDPFTEENAMKWLTNDDGLPLVTFVMRLLSMASDESAFEKENLEVLSGN